MVAELDSRTGPFDDVPATGEGAVGPVIGPFGTLALGGERTELHWVTKPMQYEKVV